MENSVTLEIPRGTHDLLPGEARKKRMVKEKLARLFADFGYEEIETPTVEYLATLKMGSDSEPAVLKLSGGEGRTIALRHEMTTPIARLTAGRLKEYPLPLKLSYVADVFRLEETQEGRQREFCQAGVELIGSTEITADAEIIALCVKSVARLKNFRVAIGSVDFVNSLIKECGVDEILQERIKHAMERRDLVRLQNIVRNASIPEQAKQNLLRLPYLAGGDAVLREAHTMTNSEVGRQALDNLATIKNLLVCYNAADNIMFDLGLIRDFGYYTGTVFEVYANGLGFPLAGGGRYDNMLGGFGRDLPATGFSLGVDRLILAAERQGIAEPTEQHSVYVGYAEGKVASAIAKANELRAQGKSVTVALTPQSKNELQGDDVIYCE